MYGNALSVIELGFSFTRIRRLYSSPLELKVFFSDGFGDFEFVGYFKGRSTNDILRCKTEESKGKYEIFKSLSDGFFWGGAGS